METRLVRTPDGAVWSPGWLDHTFWQRYLDVFDEVTVLARLATAGHAPPNAKRADRGPDGRVTFSPLPYYVGPWEYLARQRAVKRAIAAALAPDDAVILRVPGTIGTLVERAARRSGKPFGVEVVGDPAEVFTGGGVKSMLTPFLQRYFTAALRRQCAHACATAYVVNDPLQQRYPPSPTAFVTVYSSIDLTEDGFVSEGRRYSEPPRPLRIVTVASLEQLYKGPDVLIQAAARCAPCGSPTSLTRSTEEASDSGLSLTIVGDGKHRPELGRLAADVGIGERVRFAGRVPPGAAVRAELDQADLFVLASRTEGLPRALIEAMARGLPCIGTAVGGIPALLGRDELVPPNDAAELARKIIELAGDPRRLTRLSAENLAKARAYHADELRPRRRAFYQAVQDCTQEWLDRRR